VNSPARSARTAALLVVVLIAGILIGSPQVANAQTSLTAAEINARLGIGVNFGNALEGPREGVWGMTIEEDFFPTIAAAGFGHVRVPIRFSAYADATAPYTIPDGNDPRVANANNLWKRIDWVIANAEANDLYVIIDLHHSDRYATASDRVLFEVLNEPHAQFNDDPNLLTDLLTDVLGIIRQTNPTRPVLVGPPFWNNINALPSLVLPDDPNLIVSVHFYEPFAFTHQGATWVDPAPPAPASFNGNFVSFGAGWGNWSWESTATGSTTGLDVTYNNQWAGLSFGTTNRVDPASLSVTVSGAAELSVRCSVSIDESTEVTRIVTTAQSQTFQVPMDSCSDQTESIAFMLVSETGRSLQFTDIEMCQTDGTCSRLIESASQAIDSAFERAANWATANNRPLNVGEFGAYSANGLADLGERAEWTSVVRAAGDRHGFSMTYWEFGAGYGVYDRTTSSWIMPLLDALDVNPVGSPEPIVMGDVNCDDRYGRRELRRSVDGR